MVISVVIGWKEATSVMRLFRANRRSWARFLFGYIPGPGRRDNLARVLRILGRAVDRRTARGVQLIAFIDRVRGALELMLACLRSALSQRPEAPNCALALLAVRLSYGRSCTRSDGGRHGPFLPMHSLEM
jgi:hypothetical protein